VWFCDLVNAYIRLHALGNLSRLPPVINCRKSCELPSLHEKVMTITAVFLHYTPIGLFHVVNAAAVCAYSCVLRWPCSTARDGTQILSFSQFLSVHASRENVHRSFYSCDCREIMQHNLNWITLLFYIIIVYINLNVKQLK